MENKYYLYRHIRLDKNEPFYIGIGTKQPRTHNSVKSEYRRAYEINRKESYIWNKIINKTVYEVEILLESDNYDFIKQKEIEFIKLYGRINTKTGILSNLTDGGEGTVGIIKSKEQIEKHRKAMTGKKQSKSQIQKRNESRKGYIHSEETKIKISNSHKGKKPSLEHLIKLQKGQILNNSKIILQYDMKGNFIKEWESAVIAAKFFNVHPTSIRNCVKEKVNSSCGFIWKDKLNKAIELKIKISDKVKKLNSLYSLKPRPFIKEKKITKILKVTNIVTKEIKFFDKLILCSKEMDIPYNSITCYLTNNRVYKGIYKLEYSQISYK